MYRKLLYCNFERILNFQSFTTVENGDTFTTYDPDHPEIKRYGKFNETHMIMVSPGQS